jgi:DNA-directed RNA polymerase specialized sigma subunit
MSPTNDNPMTMSAAEAAEGLHSRWVKDRSPKNMSDLLDHLQPDMDRAISSYGGNVNPVARGTARMLAIKAVKSYQPKEKAQFRSWFNTQMQPLSRQMRDQKFTVKVPEAKARESFALRNALAELEAKNGLVPSEAELADQLHIPPKRIRALLAATTPEVVSENQSPDTEPDETQYMQDLVYHSVSPADQLIMQHAFGYGGHPILSGKDLAKKLRVTPAAVSQRVAKLQSMLQQAQQVAI